MSHVDRQKDITKSGDGAAERRGHKVDETMKTTCRQRPNRALDSENCEQCLHSDNHAGVFRSSYVKRDDDMNMYTLPTLLCLLLITCVGTMATTTNNCCLRGRTAPVMTSGRGWG